MRAVAALLIVFVGAAVAQNFDHVCGTTYGWAPDVSEDGWDVQTLDFASGLQSEPVQVPFLSDDESYVGAVPGRSSRMIFFLSDQQVYWYQIDLAEVVFSQAYDNSDLSFFPWGVDDVSGHIWGTWTDTEGDFSQYIAHLDLADSLVYVSDADVMEGATLFLEQSQRAIFQVSQAEADQGSQLLVRVNMFAANPPVNYTYPIYFPNAGSITIAQFGRTLVGGTTLVYDDQGEYIAINLMTGVTQPSNVASIDDFSVFGEAYYNYAIGYYDGEENDCQSPEATCFAFWDVLNEMFMPFNVTVVNESGDQIFPDQDVIYYATSC